jgi:hypothetical protein
MIAVAVHKCFTTDICQSEKIMEKTETRSGLDDAITSVDGQESAFVIVQSSFTFSAVISPRFA